MQEYICPECKYHLKQHNNTLICEQCGKEVILIDGIPVFNQKTVDYTRTKSNHEEKFQDLIRKARKTDWFHALIDTYPDKRDSVVKYVVNRKKIDFIFLLPLHTEATVLDLGCGLGPITHALAPNVKKVYAIDTLLEQVQYASIRLNQEGHGNANFACGGDNCNLPFRDSFFDVVVLNAVLQWVGLAFPEQNPILAQRQILTEIRRVLKDNGVLYLSVPNRFAMTYLIGKPDEHSFGHRFTTVLPHVVSNAIVRLKDGKNYSGKCYSYTGYKRLLKETGFDDFTFYWLFPDFRDTEFIIPFEMLEDSADMIGEILCQHYNHRNLSYMMMKYMPGKFLKYFVYHYGIICRKQG